MNNKNTYKRKWYFVILGNSGQVLPANKLHDRIEYGLI